MGRPKGYRPAPNRSITHEIGEWAWSTDNLHKRIVKTTADACWAWTGSRTPHGNIFGAYKNGQPQMTQTNRLLAMEILNEPIVGREVRMSCCNRHCANPNHFQILEPGQRPKRKKKQIEQQPNWIPPEIKLTISEHILQLLTREQQAEIKAMAQEFADTSGIDREFEYRWMAMTKENHLLAEIKYANTIKFMTVRQR